MIDIPPKVPDTASADGSETDVLCAFSPVEALASDMKFLPPQFIEFSRLAKFKQLSDLTNYATDRARHHGMSRFCPNPRFCSDGLLMILPGDVEHQIEFDLANAPDITHLDCDEAIGDLKQPTTKLIWTGAGCQIVTNNQWLNEECRVTSPVSHEELVELMNKRTV